VYVRYKYNRNKHPIFEANPSQIAKAEIQYIGNNNPVILLNVNGKRGRHTVTYFIIAECGCRWDIYVSYLMFAMRKGNGI
jgi:hypothetical protein